MSAVTLGDLESSQYVLTVYPDPNQETNNRGQTRAVVSLHQIQGTNTREQMVAYSDPNQVTNNRGQLVVSPNQTREVVSSNQIQGTNNRGQMVAYSNQNREVVSLNQTQAVVSSNQRQEINDRHREAGANQVRSDGWNTANVGFHLGAIVGLVGLILSSGRPCSKEFSSQDVVVAVGKPALVFAIIGYVGGSLLSKGTVPHVTGTILPQGSV